MLYDERHSTLWIRTDGLQKVDPGGQIMHIQLMDKGTAHRPHLSD